MPSRLAIRSRQLVHTSRPACVGTSEADRQASSLAASLSKSRRSCETQVTAQRKTQHISASARKFVGGDATHLAVSLTVNSGDVVQQIPINITECNALCVKIAQARIRFTADYSTPPRRSSRVPLGRWDTDGFRGLSTDAASYGSCASDTTRFNNRASEMSSMEGAEIDPAQRLLLEVSPDGGFGGGRVCGPSVFAEMGFAVCVAAGRLSYLFALTGPCLTIDTACSSARRAARSGECAAVARGLT